MDNLREEDGATAVLNQVWVVDYDPLQKTLFSDLLQNGLSWPVRQNAWGAILPFPTKTA